MIDNEIINKIRNSVNIVDVISNYVPLNAKGRNFFGVCPFHDDHSPSMSVSPEKQIYTCFSCGASGNVFTFLQDYEHISFIEAVKKLADETGTNLGININESKKKNNVIEHDIYNLTQKYFLNNLRSEKGLAATSYLKKRSINEDIIEKFGIGLSLNEPSQLTDLLLNKKYNEDVLIDIGLSTNDKQDIFKNRIMFPIKDKNGQIVGYSGRVYQKEDQNKYVNSKASHIFKKSEILYNYHQAIEYVRRTKYIIVVEGFMDVIRLSTIGYNNVVALMGTAITNEHISLLKGLKCKVILTLDSDEAGLNATLSAGDQLIKENIETLVIRLEDYKDPDDYIINKGENAFKTNVENATNYLDFKIKHLRNVSSDDNSEEVAKNINTLIDTVNNIKDPILKNIMIKKIATEFDIDESVVLAKVGIKDTVIVKEEKIVKPIIKYDKTEKSCMAIVYLMSSNPKFIKIYEKKLGHLPIDEYKNLANSIRNYYQKNKDINIADFITHISDNPKYKDTMNKIIMYMESSVLESEFDAYIKIIKEKLNDLRIQEIRKDMEKTTDENKKRELLNKIIDIKKEV